MTETDKFHSIWEYQVTFSDCDPAKIAYYPRMIEWFDWAGEHMFREVGLPWHEHFGDDDLNGMPMTDIKVLFHYPCRFGDKIRIKSWIDSFEAKRFTIKHELYKGERLAAESREIRAWIITDTTTSRGIRAIPVPDRIQRMFHRPVE